MIEVLPESAGNVVGARFSGAITQQDLRGIVSEVQRVLATTGKMRFLVLAEHMRWRPGWFWSDFRYTVQFAPRMERIAIVGRTRWEEWYTRIVDRLVRAEVRHFRPEQIDQAWSWLRAVD